MLEQEQAVSLLGDIHQIRNDSDQTNANVTKILFALTSALSNIEALLTQIAASNAAILAVLTKIPPVATDLDIVLDSHSQTKGSVPMANKKGTAPAVKCPCLRMSTGKGAVMPPIVLTAVPASITLQPVDASNNPVPIASTDSVTGTLASDSTAFVVGAGADTLHYVATIPANTPQGTIANLSATLNGTIQGSPANFTASVQLTLNIPPVPVAVDLDIILG